MADTPAPEVVRFGAFELDRRAGELTRAGRRVHLTPQAARLLVLLADRAGQLVTRDEIRAALWADGTFVDFEAAMNACVSQIRTALGDKATAPRFVETVPRRGYRFVAPVGALPAPAVAIGHPPAEPPPRHAPEPRGRPAAAWYAIAAVLVAASGWLVWTLTGDRAGSLLSGRHRSMAGVRLAVLPLGVPPGDEALTSLGIQLQERTLVDLFEAAGTDATVLARAAVEHLRDDGRTAEALRAAGPDLCVDAALQRLPDGRVRVHAKVVRLPDFRILWAQDYELAYDVLALRGADLARELAQRLVEMARHGPPATNTAATDLALSAGSALTQGTPAAVERAVQQLQEAVAGDPDDAGVRGLLARALVRAALQGPRPLVETLGAARDHAAAALDRAPRNADALAALGAWYFWAESDWREAGRILARAVEQSAPPSDARAWYAKWLTANGRHDAAIAQAAAIEQRAPVGNAGAPLASALYFARRFEEAAAAAERVLGFHPDSRSALSWLYLASRAAGHDARAVGALERLARVNGRSTEGEPGSLEGRRRAAVLAQLGLVTRVGEQGTHRIAVEGAVLSVEAGNLTDALEWARRAVDRREPAAVLLGVHPALAELHGDRRFVDLVARARRHRGVNSRSYLSPDLIR